MKVAENADLPHQKVDVVEGCPLCEHTDPELENELAGFARLLFEVILAENGITLNLPPDHSVDLNFGMGTLKERSTKQ